MKKYSHIITFGLLFILVFGMSGIPTHTARACNTTDPITGLPCAIGTVVGSAAGKAVAGAVGSAALDVIGTIIAPLTNTVLKIVSLITMLSGIVLNYVVNYTIVNMAQHYSGISAINTAWTTLRDVANMGFIFVLLYASIQMILGMGKDIRKLIINIIIAALLINFSLFFTQVVIDASNILALTFYNAIVPASTTGTTVLNAGISNALMQPLNLQSIWSLGGNITSKNIVTIGVMGSVLSLVAAFVFFAIAMLFVIRYVVLIFVLILSPIAFVSGIMPGLDKVWGQWKDALINQAFFAPVYMLLTWITINIFQHLPGLPGNPGGATPGTLASALMGTVTSGPNGDVMSYSPNSMDMFFNFVIVIVFLIATLLISKGMADKAGGVVSKITGKVLGKTQDAYFGGLVGGAYRNTIGLGGSMLAENASLQKAAKEKTGVGGAMARLGLYAAKKARSGTGDIRNATIPTNMVNDVIRGTVGRTDVGKKFGLDKFDEIGSIGVGGFAADQTGAGKGREKGYMELRAERDKKFDDLKKTSNEELRIAEAKRVIAAGAEASDEATGAGRALTPAEIDLVDKMEKAMARLTDKETEVLVSTNKKLLNSQAFATKISVQQLEALNKSEKFSEGEKETVKGTRFNIINTEMTRLATAPAGTAINPAVATAIKNLSNKEIEMIDPTHVMKPQFVSALKDPQVEAIGKSNKFTRDQKQAIRDERARPLNDDFATGNWVGALDKMRAMSVENLVKMDVTKLAEPGILDLYRPALLNKMAARSELTEAKADTIRQAILLAAATPGASTAINDAKDWLNGDGLKIF